MYEAIFQKIATENNFEIKNIYAVHGGDINQTFCVESNSENYFIKLNDANKFPKMFEKEANGLNALQKYFSLEVPDVLNYGIVENKQYLLLSWFEQGKENKNFWQEFGAALANMHKTKQNFFGWTTDNYIGNLIQSNKQHQSWQAFYAEERILPFVKKLTDRNIFDKADIKQAENFCKKINEIYPAEPPSFLHGDLWGGNFSVATSGKAIIYDPAVYNGHREIDLAMTKLFGGFHQDFYDAYHQTYPLENGWQQRMRYSQLLPLLVHAILFGGHYVNAVRDILTLRQNRM